MGSSGDIVRRPTAVGVHRSSGEIFMQNVNLRGVFARRSGTALMAAAVAAAVSPVVRAAPYASNVSIVGTTVNFILNEPADSLLVSINGGAPTSLDGSSKGAKSFALS